MRSYITIKSDLESVLLEKKKVSTKQSLQICWGNRFAQFKNLIGYDAERKPLENLSDIMNFLFQLDKIKELGFNIEVKRPPHYDGWECAITFNGKDVSTELNQDLCLFLEEFEDKRNEVKDYQTSLESYQKWQDKTLAYYANAKLTEKETEEISNEERIQRFQKIMNERYGKKES